MQKKGYFFMLDAALSLGVLLIGAFIIFASFTSEPPKTQTNIYSDDVIDFLSKTKIRDINNEYAGVNGVLWNQGNITMEDNTLLQQLGYFYKRGKINLANKFVENITEGGLISNYNFEILINDEIIYPIPLTKAHNDSKNSTKLLLSTNRIIYGYNDKDLIEMWGPYKAEVLTWK